MQHSKSIRSTRNAENIQAKTEFPFIQYMCRTAFL